MDSERLLKASVTPLLFANEKAVPLAVLAV